MLQPSSLPSVRVMPLNTVNIPHAGPVRGGRFLVALFLGASTPSYGSRPLRGDVGTLRCALVCSDPVEQVGLLPVEFFLGDVAFIEQSAEAIERVKHVVRIR